MNALVRHFNVIHDDFIDAVESFSWDSRRTRLALKTALACVVAVSLTDFLYIPHAFWAGISALIMMRPHVTAVVSKAWMRAGGACVGCFLSLAVLGLVAQNPWLFSAMVFLAMSLGFYLGNTNRHGYFWSYMMGHAAMITMITVMNPYEAFPVHIAFYRAAAVTIGVTVSVIVNVVLWPDLLAGRIKTERRRFLLELGKSLNELLNSHADGTPPSPKSKRRLKNLSIMLATWKDMENEDGIENTLFREENEAAFENPTVYAPLLDDCVELRRGLSEAARDSPSEFHDHFADPLRQAAKSVTEISLAMASGDEDKVARDELAATLDELERRHEQSASTPHSLDEVSLFLNAFGCLKHFLEIAVGEAKTFVEPAPLSARRVSEDFFRTTVFRRPVSIHVPTLIFAVKGGLAILGVFWLWLWFQIPGGGLNMSVAVVTVMQMDMMTTVHKGILRLSGCLLGAALGLFFLSFNIEAMTIWAFIMFCVIFALAYIWGAKPGVAYLGAQAGLAFLVAFANNFGPVESLAPAIERLTGISLGVTCVLIMNFIIWPQNPLNDLRKRIRAAKRRFDDIRRQAVQALLHPEENPPPLPASFAAADIESVVDMLFDQNELSFTELRAVKTLINDMAFARGQLALLLREYGTDVAAAIHRADPTFLDALDAKLREPFPDDTIKPEQIENPDPNELQRRIIGVGERLRGDDELRNAPLDVKRRLAFCLDRIQAVAAGAAGSRDDAVRCP